MELTVKDIEPGTILPRVQISPFGTYPGEKSNQVCDRAAFDQLVADWKANGAKEILMDFEHQSEVERIDSDTKAAAWITNLAVDDDLGLVGDFKFTERGANAVNARELRFLSPTWFTDADGRPKHLTSVALTNKPNIPVKPILNKKNVVGELVVGSWSGDQRTNQQPTTNKPTNKTLNKKNVVGELVVGSWSGDQRTNQLPTTNKPTNKTKGPNMEKIKEALGLPPEASDEEVLNAVKASVAKNKECECAALEKEADEFAEQNAKKCNKEVLKAQYIANKEIARAIVAGIPDAPAPAEPQKILNKGTAPKDAEGLELQRNKAIADYRAAHPNCDFSTAWSACRTASPDLF